MSVGASGDDMSAIALLIVRVVMLPFSTSLKFDGSPYASYWSDAFCSMIGIFSWINALRGKPFRDITRLVVRL